MWTLIITSVVFIGGIIFSLGKSSSQREEMANRQREELLARKTGESSNNKDKFSNKNEPPSVG